MTSATGAPNSWHGANRHPSETLLKRALMDLAAGRLAAAAITAEQIVSVRPRDASAINILGVIALRQRRLEEAKSLFQRALAAQPRNPFIHCNAGQAHHAVGDLEAALRHYRVATRLSPQFAEAHVHLGDVLRDLGNLAHATSAYRAALRIQPRLAGALNGIGLILQRSAQDQDADEHFESALSLRPLGDPAAVASIMANAGCARLRRGHGLDGFEALTDAVRECPGSALPWRLLGAHLRHTKVAPQGPEFREVLMALFQRPDVDPANLATAVLAVLRCDSGVAAMLAAAAERPADPVEFSPPFDAALARLLSEPLLPALLAATPITDLGLEVLLTRLRERLLTRCHGSSGVEADLPLICALAEQCLLNGFIFHMHEAEAARAQALCADLASVHANRDPAAWRRLAIAACYQPLWEIGPDLSSSEEAPPCMHTLLRSLENLATEARLARRVRRLNDLDPDEAEGGSACGVAHPRWTATETPNPMPFRAAISAQLPYVPAQQLPSPSRSAVLIFGQGGGAAIRHALNSYADAEIVAVDPSALDLAYTMRQLGDAAAAVEFVQGESADLHRLERRFDLVHVACALDLAPRGLLAISELAACVKPGGLLRLALQNTFARHTIGPDLDRLHNYPSLASSNELRRFRRDLIIGPRDQLRAWLLSPASEFWTEWQCRRTSASLAGQPAHLAQVESMLEPYDLEFLGLQLSSILDYGRFMTEHPEPGARSDLQAWAAFERKHPEVFGGTYQMWARRRHELGNR